MKGVEHQFSAQAEVISEDAYATFPVAFTLIRNPDADPTVMEQAAKAITAFIADSRTGGGFYDF